MPFGPSSGHDLPKALPQLKRLERAAHTGNLSEHAFGQIGQNSPATQTDFGPDGFRSSSLTTPASQSGLHPAKGEVRPNRADPYIRLLLGAG